MVEKKEPAAEPTTEEGHNAHLVEPTEGAREPGDDGPAASAASGRARPKGNGRRPPDPTPRLASHSGDLPLAVAIPAWNMRVQVMERRAAAPGGAFAIHAPFEADEMPGGCR